MLLGQRCKCRVWVHTQVLDMSKLKTLDMEIFILKLDTGEWHGRNTQNRFLTKRLVMRSSNANSCYTFQLNQFASYQIST